MCSTISRPLVNAALNGFNGTLMAYGQTGSGMNFEFLLSSFRGVTGRGGVGKLDSARIPSPLGNDFPLGQQHTSLIIQVIKTLEYKESAWHKSNLVLDSSYAGLYHRVNMSPLTHRVDQLYKVLHVRCA